MDENTYKISKLIISFLTPLIVFIFGLVFNRKLENTKTFLLKEKDWQNWWANKFLFVSHEYSNNISKIITDLFLFKQINKEKYLNWKKESNDLLIEIQKTMNKLQYLEWEIQNYTKYSKNYGNSVYEKAKKLFNLIGLLISKKEGNLESIRTTQFEFNDSVRLAHREILGLDLQ